MSVGECRMHVEVLKRGDTPWELRRFRYEVYVRELNRQQKYANHDEQTIADPLDAFSTNIIARDGNNIVACLRASFLRDGDTGYYKRFYRVNEYFASFERITLVTQLMISGKCRKYKVARLLCEQVYEYAFLNEIDYCLIDCNDPLESMFKKLGFITLFKDRHFDYGPVNVMLLDLCDVEHLRAVRSPFAAVHGRLSASNDEKEVENISVEF